MSKQKKSATKQEEHHSLLEIAGEKAAALKDAIIEGKNKIVSATEEKFESVKKAIQDYTSSTKKAAVKKSVKKMVKKATPKKPIKKIAKKAVKKAVKKVAKKLAKKK